MNKLLFAALTAFGRAFIVTFVMAVTGILAAPNVSSGVALSIAAIVAAIVAGLRAIQVFIPQISFAAFVPQPVAAYLDSFARAFLAALVAGVIGLLEMPDLPTGRSIWLAVIIGALTAGVRAIQGLLTPDDSPAPQFGLQDRADLAKSA